MPKYIIYFLCVSTLFSKSLDLLEVFKLSLPQSETFKISKYKTNYADDGVDKSLSSFYPQATFQVEKINLNEFPVVVNGVVEERRTDKEDATFRVDQVIYDRSKYLNYQKASNSLDQAHLEQDKVYQELMFDVIKYYFESVLKYSKLQLLGQKLKQYEKIVERARIKYQTGFISKANYLESELEKDTIVTQKIQMELEFNIAQSYLEKFTQIPRLSIKKEIRFNNLKSENLSNELKAMNYSLDLRLQNLKFKASKIDKSIAFSGFEPTLNLSYENISHDVPGVDTEKTVTLLLKIPLFSGFSDLNSYQQARVAQMIEERTTNNLLRDLKQGISNSTATVSSYLDILKRYPKIIEYKELSVENMREAFDKGSKTIIDLLDEENKYYTKLNEYTEYQYRYIIELASLKKQTSSLNMEFLKMINGYVYE